MPVDFIWIWSSPDNGSSIFLDSCERVRIMSYEFRFLVRKKRGNIYQAQVCRPVQHGSFDGRLQGELRRDQERKGFRSGGGRHDTSYIREWNLVTSACSPKKKLRGVGKWGASPTCGGIIFMTILTAMISVIDEQ